MPTNVDLTPMERVSSFRKIAIGTWDAPRDPQIYGSLTVRMEDALAYIERYRRATGRRLTVTHLVGKAIARALREVPDANAMLRFGRPYRRDRVSVFFSVATEDPRTGEVDLSGAKLDDVDEKPLAAILDELEAAVSRVRSGADPELARSPDSIVGEVLKDPSRATSSRSHPKARFAREGLGRPSMRRVPFLAMRSVLNAISFGLYGLDLDLTALGVPKDPFGSVIVTNIGSLGLSEAYAPLMAYSRTPLLLAVGEVRDTAVVERGAVVAAKVMRIHATLDHRLLDGTHAARIARVVTETLERPFEHLDAIPERAIEATR